MSLHGLAYGSVAYGGADEDVTGSQASVLNTLLANPKLEREYRLVTYPTDPDASLGTYIRCWGSTTTVNYGDVCDVGAFDSLIISFLIRKQPNTVGLLSTLVSKMTGFSSTGYALFWEAGDTLLLRINDGVGNTDCRSSNVRYLADGKWHRVCAFIDRGLLNSSVIYVDGEMVSSNVNIALMEEEYLPGFPAEGNQPVVPIETPSTLILPDGWNVNSPVRAPVRTGFSWRKFVTCPERIHSSVGPAEPGPRRRRPKVSPS